MNDMYFSKRSLFIFLSWISMIAKTSADYCEWGYCSLSEYCCGDNECCKDDKTTWILVFALLTALVLLSICCGCFYRQIDYYRLRMQWPFSSSSDPLIRQSKA